MATYPKYTKKTLKPILSIFETNDDDLLAAYYPGASKDVLDIAQAKLNSIISKMKELIESNGLITKEDSEILNNLISEFVNGSPIVANSKRSTQVQGDRYVRSANNLISFSQSLMSNVMKFRPKSGKTDQAHIFLREYQNKINAYNTLLKHKLDGTLEFASEEDIAIMAKGFHSDNPNIKSKDIMPGLMAKSLNEVVDEYSNYLDNDVLKNPALVTIAKMQHLDKAGHTPEIHTRNISIIVGSFLTFLLMTLSGAPLNNGSLQPFLEYIGTIGSISGAVGLITSALVTTAVTLPGGIRGKNTNNKMLNLDINQMQRVFELIRGNKPSKSKKLTECISEINQQLKEEKIPIEINASSYKILSKIEKVVSKNPLVVSKVSTKQNRKTKKGVKKAHKTDPIKHRGLARSILVPIYDSINRLAMENPRAPVNTLLSLLNPDNALQLDSNVVHVPSNDSPVNNGETQVNVRTKSPKQKAKIEIEEMVGYNDTLDALQDSSENNTSYDFKSKKKAFQKESTLFSITIKKTKLKLTEQEALSILDLLEKKINKVNFTGGPITHEETGTVIEVNTINRSKPKSEKKEPIIKINRKK